MIFVLCNNGSYSDRRFVFVETPQDFLMEKFLSAAKSEYIRLGDFVPHNWWSVQFAASTVAWFEGKPMSVADFLKDEILGMYPFYEDYDAVERNLHLSNFGA